MAREGQSALAEISREACRLSFAHIGTRIHNPVSSLLLRFRDSALSRGNLCLGRKALWDACRAISIKRNAIYSAMDPAARAGRQAITGISGPESVARDMSLKGARLQEAGWARLDQVSNEKRCRTGYLRRRHHQAIVRCFAVELCTPKGPQPRLMTPLATCALLGLWSLPFLSRTLNQIGNRLVDEHNLQHNSHLNFRFEIAHGCTNDECVIL